jgi:hypothetical protein
MVLAGGRESLGLPAQAPVREEGAEHLSFAGQPDKKAVGAFLALVDSRDTSVFL